MPCMFQEHTEETGNGPKLLDGSRRPCLIVAIVVIIVILVSVVPVVIRLRPPSPSSIVSVVEYGYLRYHEKARPST
ncbi:hypothetical protein CGCFRS4_v005460 [Colletotrichum fructicola]|nr:hypothetical protein CGCFRS4_v005460 [Colletotrichum fructicola]KAF4935551.1 hypothetical protein CGCF245_v007545 [Colletotrichum fructicola]